MSANANTVKAAPQEEEGDAGGVGTGGRNRPFSARGAVSGFLATWRTKEREKSQTWW